MRNKDLMTIDSLLMSDKKVWQLGKETFYF